MMNMKKIAKITGAVCAATGIVALGSLVASGAAVLAVKEGFKAAKDTFGKILKDERSEKAVPAEKSAEAEASEVPKSEEPAELNKEMEEKPAN